MAVISTFVNSFVKFPPKSGFQTKRRHMALKRHIKKANSSKQIFSHCGVSFFCVAFQRHKVEWMCILNQDEKTYWTSICLCICGIVHLIWSSQARSAVFLLTRGGVCGTGEPINGSFIWHNGRIERKWTLRGKRSETNLLHCNTKPRWNCLWKWWHKIKSFTNSGNMHFRRS